MYGDCTADAEATSGNLWLLLFNAIVDAVFMSIILFLFVDGHACVLLAMRPLIYFFIFGICDLWGVRVYLQSSYVAVCTICLRDTSAPASLLFFTLWI